MSLGSPYDSFDDPYCYPGTSVLKNNLDLRDYTELEAFEHESASAKGDDGLPAGLFDSAHYCAIHRHLFGEVYDWAGEYRTVRTAKGGDMFCYPEYIADQMALLLTALAVGPLAGGGTRTEFIAASTQFLSDLNAIHPFRDGNGRTQLTFLFLLGERAGHRLDMARIRPEAMLSAMVESFHGRIEALRGEMGWICG